MCRPHPANESGAHRATSHSGRWWSLEARQFDLSGDERKTSELASVLTFFRRSQPAIRVLHARCRWKHRSRTATAGHHDYDGPAAWSSQDVMTV